MQVYKKGCKKDVMKKNIVYTKEGKKVTRLVFNTFKKLEEWFIDTLDTNKKTKVIGKTILVWDYSDNKPL
tara:strand:- start:1166 stop:1375 length:210 start_codon:yes stop_codon:yes gene_type:complete